MAGVGVDRDAVRYLNTIYHGADNTTLAGRISGELTPGYFLSGDAGRVGGRGHHYSLTRYN